MALAELQTQIDAFVEEHLSGASIVKEPKVVHDGLWRTLRLRPEEVCLIDTPLVQRLRHIHQTGWAFMTYPSTTHTRFEHTLGVILQVQQLGEALSRLNDGSSFTDQDINQMRIAALLHDVGHGILSHTSEECYRNHPAIVEFRKAHKAGSPHEILSYLILNSPPFQVYFQRLCDEYSPCNLSEIADAIIGKPHHDPENIYKFELINGPFDADKLDYLFRDSHFSGIPLSVDLHRLWYTVRIGIIEGRKRLVVTLSGAGPLEQILFAKMTLSSIVYQHHKVRACDCMFKGIIEYMKTNEVHLTQRAYNMCWDSPIDFLRLTDSSLLSFGYETGDDNLHKLIHDLYFRRLLKRALIISMKTIKETEDDKWADLQEHAKDTERAERFKREIAAEIWECAGKPCLLQQVWIDMPRPRVVPESQDTFVIPSQGLDPIPLNELFPIEPWQKQYTVNKWRGHVFCPPENREAISKAAKSVLEEKFEIEFLPEAFQWAKLPEPH